MNSRCVSWSLIAGICGSYTIRAASGGDIATITSFASTLVFSAVTVYPFLEAVTDLTGALNKILSLPILSAKPSPKSPVPPTILLSCAPPVAPINRSNVPGVVSFPADAIYASTYNKLNSSGPALQIAFVAVSTMPLGAGSVTTVSKNVAKVWSSQRLAFGLLHGALTSKPAA